MMNPRICRRSAMSKSSDTCSSLHIFSCPSAPSMNAASWIAFQRKKLRRAPPPRSSVSASDANKEATYALCPTNGATSPLAHAECG